MHTALVVTLLVAPMQPPQNGSADRAVPRAVAGRLEGEVRLDGRLDEAVWERVPRLSPFTVVEPTEGATPTAPTRVSLLLNAREILIGVHAYDPQPEGIVAFSMERDADLANEDHVRLMLDTFLNGRTGYVFAINPSGARYDALITGSGETERKEWDASWEAATARTDSGWSAEIRIPVQSLAYREELAEWGLNVERRVQRRLEVSRWSSAWRTARLTQPARAGRLTGLPRFVYGRGLTVRPAAVSGIERLSAGDARRAAVDWSGDVSQRIGANTLASLTFNTDFAETEVDGRRTNLTRFPLFFPEKRTFFLEGSDIFDFSPAEGRQVDIVPLHSRRIGLLGGAEVPIRAGAKVNGRVRGTHFAALAVRTGPADTLAPSTSMTAMRLRQNLLSESSAGVLFTTGDPEGRPGAWTAGADVAFRSSRLGGRHNLLATGWVLATGRDALGGDRSAFGATIAYPTDPWHAVVGYKRIGAGFDPSLGFVPRRGVDIVTGGFDYRWHTPFRGVRDAIFQMHGRLVRDSLGRQESYSVLTAPFYLALESGDRIEFNVVPIGERLSQPFPIAADVSIPGGTYDWIRYRVEATFASKRPVSGRLTWWFGDFYDGRLTERQASVIVRQSSRAALELTAVRNHGVLPAGSFEQRLWGGRVQLNVSPDLTLNSLIQYDDQSRILGANTRVRWQFHPLGELFVVYNRNRVRETGAWVFASEQLLAKLQYAWRF